MGGALECVRAFASKAAEHAARIAAVLTLFEGASVVVPERVADAVELAKFYLSEASSAAR